MNAQIDISDVTLKTPRLTLRPWRAEDLEDFYEYARVDGVGQMAGWLPHRSMDESRQILESFINGKKTFALVFEGKVIGSLGIERYREEDFPGFMSLRCRELGFVLSKAYWGRGLMPEAVNEAVRWLFEDMGLDAVFCAHFISNTRSRRVQEKCGFVHHSFGKFKTHMDTVEDDERRVLTRDSWEWKRMYEAARAVQNGRSVSKYVEAGGVAAAILSETGRIYTGVCVDTCCTLGICAERNAIFHMLTCGENRLRKVLALMSSGRLAAPCGACRELMVQLMPEDYKAVQIMLDYENKRVTTLGELTPEWWI